MYEYKSWHMDIKSGCMDIRKLWYGYKKVDVWI